VVGQHVSDGPAADVSLHLCRGWLGAECGSDAYGARARRVVLTRLDEGDSVAPLLKLIAERDLTLSYLGTGQRVPDDLERASGAALAGHILGPEGPEGLAA